MEQAELEITLIRFINEYAVKSEQETVYTRSKPKILNNVSVDILAKDLTYMLKRRGIVK